MPNHTTYGAASSRGYGQWYPAALQAANYIATKVVSGTYYSYWSVDGTTWNPITTNPSYGSFLLNNVIYGTTNYATADLGGTSWNSPDGVNWTPALTFPNSSYPFCIAYGNGKFVINDNYGDRVWYSSDGINWTYVPLTYVSGNISAYINYVDNKYVMTNSTFNALESSDAITWTTASYAPNSQFFAKLNNYYVSVYYTNSYFEYSTDKVTWASPITTLISNTRRMAYGNSVYVAVGQGGISYSPNITTWTLSNITGVDVRNITYGDGRFLAASANGILTSNDGATWTTVLAGNFTEVYCKTYPET